MIDFPKIFVINLKRSIERKELVEKQFNDLDLDYEICEAVDGNELSYEEIKRYYSDEESNRILKRSLSKEEIGCYLSHVNIHKKVVKENIPFAIVFEDDISLDSQLIEVVKSLLDKKNDWDFVQFYYSHACLYFWYKIRLTSKYNLRKFVNVPWGTAAYILNYSGSKEILNNSLPIIFPFDDYVNRVKKKRMKIRGIHPICVKHIPFKIIESTMKERETLKLHLAEKNPTYQKIFHYLKVNFENLFKKFDPISKIY